jgi:hypothetical protein
MHSWHGQGKLYSLYSLFTLVTHILNSAQLLLFFFFKFFLSFKCWSFITYKIIYILFWFVVNNKAVKNQLPQSTYYHHKLRVQRVRSVNFISHVDCKQLHKTRLYACCWGYSWDLAQHILKQNMMEWTNFLLCNEVVTLLLHLYWWQWPQYVPCKMLPTYWTKQCHSHPEYFRCWL